MEDIYHDDEQLQDLCVTNGVSYSRLDEDGEDVFELEMFFSGFPTIRGLHHFPNIQRLVIMQQSIENIHGLDCLLNLRELWLCECKITKIANLDKCELLSKLYLYNNQIKKIENIEKLKQLQVLWLNSNNISKIENLSTIKRLRELNLADNFITEIGDSLEKNVRLETLNLSANRITFLKDVIQLCHLPQLKHLCLKDPHYLPSPVSLLWNYSTYILYHIPQLATLDTYTTTSKEIAQVVESAIQRKVIFYDAKMKTLDYHKNCWSFAARHLNRWLLTGYYSHTEHLTQLLKMVQEVPLTVESLQEKLKLIQDTLAKCEARYNRYLILDGNNASLERVLIMLHGRLPAVVKELGFTWVEGQLLEAVHYMERVHNCRLNCLQTELSTCGNVRLEEPSPTDTWYDCCCDLIMSHFCEEDYQPFGISGIEVLGIHKVINRAVRLRFDNQLTSFVPPTEDDFNFVNRMNEHRKQQDFLFWMCDGDSVSPSLERVVEEGFLHSHLGQKKAESSTVRLYNCLYLADQWRLQQHFYTTGPNQSLPCTFRYGRLLVCRVFLGKSIMAEGNKTINPNVYPKATSVFKPKKMILKHQTSSSSSSVEHHTGCKCLHDQLEWHIFNRDFIVPEYIVQFKYNVKDEPNNPFLQMDETFIENEGVRRVSLCQWTPSVEEAAIEDTVNLLIEQLSEVCCYKDPEEDGGVLSIEPNHLSPVAITHLNLSQQNLLNLSILQLLPSLVKLEVSFNRLTDLDLVAMPLEYLDASFNQISTLQGMKRLAELKYFNVSWNHLTDVKHALCVIEENMPSLETLDTRRNHWREPVNFRLHLIVHLDSISVINRAAVAEEEYQSAVDLRRKYQPSPVLLQQCGRTDCTEPRLLGLLNIAQTLDQTNRHTLENINTTDRQWLFKITSVNLDGFYLRDLTCLESLPMLRWVSLNGNQLTTLQGLGFCPYLEEVSATDNCIRQIGDLSQLTKLRRLHLANNYLYTLTNCGLTHLSELTYLSLEGNSFTSLDGFNELVGLQQLYLSHNRIACCREVIIIKNLKNLTVVDFGGNPMAKEMEDYRLYMIFHLRGLQLLDGSSVEPSEATIAKDMFGGRLTPDFISERLGPCNSNELKELNLPTCSIRMVDLGFGANLWSLTSVNLEHNLLTSFCGLIYLPNLKVLCLNNNKVECIMSPHKVSSLDRVRPSHGAAEGNTTFPGYTEGTEWNFLSKLEVLHLGYNDIKSLAHLQIYRLPSLKALFLQGNDITKIEGLETLKNLVELVLDANKIRTVGLSTFAAQQQNLLELHMEENRLVSLSGFNCLTKLERIYLGNNKIQEISELENLKPLIYLTDISLANNPISKKTQIRYVLINQTPLLTVINGTAVTEEEHIKAETYLAEQLRQSNSAIASQANMLDAVLPLITSSNIQLNYPKQAVPQVGSTSATMCYLTNMVDSSQPLSQEKY